MDTVSTCHAWQYLHRRATAPFPAANVSPIACTRSYKFSGGNPKRAHAARAKSSSAGSSCTAASYTCMDSTRKSLSRMAAATLDATTSGGDSVVSMVSCGPGIRASSCMWVSAVIATVSTVVPVRGLPRHPTSQPEQVSTTVRSGRQRAAGSAR